MVPIFIVRQKGDQYKIFIEPPIYLEEKNDFNEMLYVNVAKITKIIEGYVRRYPHEWGWMHRRWKGQTPSSSAPDIAEQSLNS